MSVKYFTRVLFWIGYPLLLLSKIFWQLPQWGFWSSSRALQSVKVETTEYTIRFWDGVRLSWNRWKKRPTIQAPTNHNPRASSAASVRESDALLAYEWIEVNTWDLQKENWRFTLSRYHRNHRLQLREWVNQAQKTEQEWRPASVQFLGFVILLTTLSTAGYSVYSAFLRDLPSPYLLREQKPAATTKIYDRDGNLLYRIFKDENRTVVALNQVSPYLVQATLAIEDAQFYEHWGVSVRGIARAFVHNVQNESTHGGSTITQQLVKNQLLTPERTWQRKIREAILAVEVDALYTKEEILERYLNEVNYGGSVYGVEEASQWYFGKPAQDLSLAESALLAGLPVAPSAYSPFGPHPDRAKFRQEEVLFRMKTLGFISEEQFEQARSEKLSFRQGTYDIESPHFVMFIRELLAAQFGEEMVSQGGLEVYTTLDSTVQASAEASLAQEVDRLKRLRVSNGAALVTNPNSGEVLAMVGSRDYFDVPNDGQVNVVFRERQPGSSIKPVTYVTAFERGFTPSDLIDDAPVVYKAQGAPPYQPKNYDGRYHGKVSLREALANSYNIPAVRLLAEVGVDALVQQGREMGITTWNDSSRYGLALTLGAGEVTMYDMARVYGTFASGGVSVPLNPLLSVKAPDGKMLYENTCAGSVVPCQGNRVLSQWHAYQITDILSDNNARASAFGRNSVLHIPGQQVAVKTGTTNSLRDNWTIGYTTDRVVVTWVGNNDNTPMSAVASGVTGASPIWHNIMVSLLGDQRHTFAMPTGFQKVKICATTRTLPCNGCPKVVEEVLPVGQIPQQACSPEQFTKTDEKQDTATGRPTARRN